MRGLIPVWAARLTDGRHMDRIAALRRIEDALADIEVGETDLEGCERRVRATVRTFTTKFDGDLAAYEAEDGIVVAAYEREPASALGS